jgi:hypothetical protein
MRGMPALIILARLIMWLDWPNYITFLEYHPSQVASAVCPLLFVEGDAVEVILGSCPHAGLVLGTL